MSDATSATSNTTSTAEAAPPRKRSPWRLLQFSLLSILLLTVAIAVWLAYRRTLQETAQMRRELPSLREVARELIVADPERYAVVQHHQMSMADFRWRIHLPQGRPYKLALATHNISPNNSGSLSSGSVSSGPAAATCEISSGEHELELQKNRREDQSWQVLVLVDGEVVMEKTLPEEWEPSMGSAGGSWVSGSVQQDVEQPLVLFRRRFVIIDNTGIRRTPRYPSNGIALWIDAK